jgi:hypothetical protein
MKIQNKRPTPPTLSYLLPYLMMAAAVLTFVWLVFFSNPIPDESIPDDRTFDSLQ